MSPGIGLMDRRLKTEKDAVSLAMSGIIKKYVVESKIITTLETKYDDLNSLQVKEVAKKINNEGNTANILENSLED